MGKYTVTHIHSDLSLLDSCTAFEDYVDRAVDEGMTAIASTEHGKQLNWVNKKLYCDSKGIKFICGCEIYLTATHDEKVRDNYHTICLCKNLNGIKELNSLVSLASTDSHFYYVPRVSFEEFLNISDNIITTSACLASPLNKLNADDPWFEKLVQKYDYLEVQPHNHPDQIEFNKKLFELSKKYNKQLICGTDTHSLNEYKAQCRDVLLIAKHKKYDDDEFDLTWKTYDELVDAFKLQNALPESVFMEAISNTNVVADMVEDFQLDQSFKYPIMYGSSEADSEKFVEIVEEKFQDKLDKGIIPESQKDAFRKHIDEEMAVFKSLDMNGFMLSQSDIISWCKDNGIPIGTSRGSVGGSCVAYVTDIIDLNPITWNTNFYRFCNADRKDSPDIDCDCTESDRPVIFKHIIEKFGEKQTARVASYGTLQDKAVIDEIGRALAEQFKEKFPDKPNPYSLEKISEIKNNYEKDPENTRLANKTLFYFFDGLLGTRISQSVHPAGIAISSLDLDAEYGVFIKDGERCLMLDMDGAHEAGIIKYDMLILKTVQVINDTCKMIGIPYPRTHEINFNDEEVWNSITQSAAALFQFESNFAFDSLKKFKPRSVEDITLVTAAIRPSGASYRDRLLNRQIETGWPEQINEILKDNYNYLVYQEDVLNILMQACGLSGSEADTVRRGIAKKNRDLIDKSTPRIVEGYCSHSDKERADAEKEALNLIQVLEDASEYMFGKNHSVGYSLLTYMCAYFRHYYPFEFITSYLNDAANDDDIRMGTEYAKRVGIMVTMPKWGYSKGEYFYDKEHNVIAKGLSSIKYMGNKVASELYDIAHRKSYTRFMDVLRELSSNSSIDARQLDILIKIDFFSEFANERILLYLADIFSGMFKKGNAKQIRKSLVDGCEFEGIIQKYSTGLTKSGGQAANYILLDIDSILNDIEDMVMSSDIEDLSDAEKMKNFAEVMGYAGYVSGKEEDRRKLYLTDIKPLHRKKDGKQFGYSFFTRSIGSGIESRFTVFNPMYNLIPVKKGDIIRCESYTKEGIYYTLNKYVKVN